MEIKYDVCLSVLLLCGSQNEKIYICKNLCYIMPKINIRRNQRKDQRMFRNFLLNERYLRKWGHLATHLMQLYPGLEERLDGVDTKSEKKQEINDFVVGLYLKKRGDVDMFLARLKTIFTDNVCQTILDGLAETMDYEFPDSAYSIYPSFIPGALYGQRKGFATLYVMSHEEDPLIDLIIHEMSHVVWMRKIGDVYERAGLRYDPKEHDKSQLHKPLDGRRRYLINEDAHEYLKEISAPIIIRCGEFDGIRQYEWTKQPNPHQRSVNVEYEGQTYSLVDFFDRIFKIERGTPFDDIMVTSAEIIYSIQDELTKKKQLFDETIQGRPFSEESWEELWGELVEAGHMEPIVISSSFDLKHYFDI